MLLTKTVNIIMKVTMIELLFIMKTKGKINNR